MREVKIFVSPFALVLRGEGLTIFHSVPLPIYSDGFVIGLKGISDQSQCHGIALAIIVLINQLGEQRFI